MSGSVSGEMDNAISGVAWTDEGYAATIPQELAPNTEPEGGARPTWNCCRAMRQNACPILVREEFSGLAPRRRRAPMFSSGAASCRGVRLLHHPRRWRAQ